MTNKIEKMERRGVYIHIPFCPYKCNYCDFLTFSNIDKQIPKYMEYLFKEIDLYKGEEGIIDTIFIGGGTPSYIDAEYISDLMDRLRKAFNISEDCEISIEMNPNTITEEKIKTYIKAGINRFSLGVQTFDNEILKILGRSHSKEIVLNDIEIIKKSGGDNINIDMMLANPKQDMEILERDIDQVISLGIQHISYYSLILEERTYFYYLYEKGQLDLFDDDLERKMFARVKDRLKDSSFSHYEVSNFALEGYESRHNLKYWSQQKFYGIGLGSSGFDGQARTKNYSKFKDYFACIDQGVKPFEEVNELSKEELEKEFIIMSMRQIKGFRIQEINDRFKINFLEKYKDLIEKYSANGVVQEVDGYFRFTEYGMDISNQFYVEII